jgi:hypothetical protein
MSKPNFLFQINIKHTLLSLLLIFFSNNLFAEEKTGCGDQQSRQLLTELRMKDQKIRVEYFEALKEKEWAIEHPEVIRLANLMAEMDAENQATLDQIIALCGWPSYDSFGYESGRAAQLVALHAINLTKYFPYIAIEFKKKQLSGEIYALFVDKMLVNEGKLQRYGTQIHMATKKLAPVEDPAHINENRLAIGLDVLPEFPLPVTAEPSKKNSTKNKKKKL